MGGGNCRSLLIDTMAHWRKYPKHITLCGTNAVILLLIVIIVSTYQVGLLPNPNKFHVASCKILKLWGDKAIARMAIFSSFEV